MDKQKQQKSRMTLELPARAKTKLENISGETDQSLSEVIRRSLSVYDLLRSEIKKGGILVIRSPEGERELLITEFID